MDKEHDMRLKPESELRNMLENHYRYTDSAVARRILQDWQASLAKFVKVMPVGYKRALEQMKKGAGY